jgi:isoleucyl-tRNA synthetase
MDQLGTDGLRLWAASIDLSGEAVVSPLLLENVKEVFRKVRNTARFLLSNLADFDIEKDAIAFDELLLIDRHALQELGELNSRIISDYNSYDFTAVSHALGDYCSSQLSSLYLDIIKDRLYVEKANGHLRRSAQTSCWYILDALTRLMAPIISFTAEQIADLYQKNKKDSIHLQKFAVTDFAKPEQDQWDMLRAIRSAVLKAIEGLREKGIIKHSLEARVLMYMDADAAVHPLFKVLLKELQKTPQGINGFFEEFFIVSSFSLQTSAQGLTPSEYPGLSLAIEKAAGEKCPRCWQWKETVHEHKLCQRCQHIVS